jgi:hypothetical protein
MKARAFLERVPTTLETLQRCCDTKVVKKRAANPKAKQAKI